MPPYLVFPASVGNGLVGAWAIGLADPTEGPLWVDEGHLAVPPLHTTGHTGHVPGGSTGLSWDTDMESGQSRALGCWLRHDWFGPLAAADRSFTLVRRFQGQ